MKYIKISLTFLIPAAIGGMAFCGLYACSGHFTALYSHDVYESHTHEALVPFMAAISLLLAFIPALFYVADIIWKPRPITPEAAAQTIETLTSPTPISVGQIFTYAGSNCKLRVKAIKNDLFTNADFSTVEYCLQFSF